MEQIMTMGKKFLIIGNTNAISYKEIFPYLKDNKMWLGYRNLGADMFFHITDEYKKEIVNEKKEGSGWKEIDGEICGRVASACWFTNLEHNKIKEYIGLVKKYNPTDYPKYDNYDAIEVGCYKDIPKDYDGVMGVPITFLGRHNPKQFEILWLASGHSKTSMPKDVAEMLSADFEMKSKDNTGNGYVILNGTQLYHRIFIRKVKELPTEEEVKNIFSSGTEFVV